METYRERLTAPLGWWLGALALAATCGWIILVVGNVAAAVVAGLVVLAPLAWALLSMGRFEISIVDDVLHVGGAQLPAAFRGDVEVLDVDRWRAVMGPQADARAWIAARPYVRSGVKVLVDDDADPVPYWMVASRRPLALAHALGADVDLGVLARPRATGAAVGQTGDPVVPAAPHTGTQRKDDGGEEEVTHEG